MYREIHQDNIEARALASEIHDLLKLYGKLSFQTAKVRFSDFDPYQHPDWQNNLIVLRTEPLGDYHYLYYGEELVRATGLNMTGRNTNEFEGEKESFFRDAYDLALSSKRPVYTIHRSTYAIEVHLWERLIIPTYTNDGSARLVVFSQPREMRKDLLSAILDASPVGIMVLCFERDSTAHIIDAHIATANRLAATLLGQPVDQLVDSKIRTVFPNLVQDGIWDRFIQIAKTRKGECFEALYTKGQENLWLKLAAAPFHDGVLISFSDISDLKNAYFDLEERQHETRKWAQASEEAKKQLLLEIKRREALEQELRHLASTDPLTNLPNRRFLAEAATRFVASAKRYNTPLSMIAVDLDHFKKINDDFGHVEGDIVLKKTGLLLQAELRTDVDVLGRMGGEEFLILLPSTSLEGACIVAERLRVKLESASICLGEVGISVTASFGVAQWVTDEPFEQLLKRVDSALYEAKHSGRNQVSPVYAKTSKPCQKPDASAQISHRF